MASNLSQFNAGLNKWNLQVQSDVARTVRQLAFAIDRELVRRTPVGNPELWAANRGRRRGDKGFVGKNYTGGRARANWIPTLEVPSNETIEKPDPTGASSIAKMAQVTSKYRLGAKVWIVNNLPYIEALSNGHSKQAPPGWIEGAIQVGIRTVLKK